MSRPCLAGAVRTVDAIIADLCFQFEQWKRVCAEHPDHESRSYDWYQGRVHQCFHTLKHFEAVVETECPCSYCEGTNGVQSA